MRSPFSAIAFGLSAKQALILSALLER